MKLILFEGPNGDIAGYKEQILKLNIFDEAQIYELVQLDIDEI